MLHYPKIPGSKNAPLEKCIAFEKVDGTNLHWDWDREFGWHSFGTRRDGFNLDESGYGLFRNKHQHLADCIPLFWNTLAQPLEQIFREHSDFQPFSAMKAFAEFAGPNSFAGLHQADEPKELRLFDVEADSFGLLGPETFVSHFSHLPVPRVVYRGKLTGQFLEDVREGKYDVAEGVVCKGGTGGNDLWMMKVKTYAYLDRLKQSFGNRWEEYGE